MIILGIETSCDETAAAILETKGGHLSILSNIVSSQIKLHSKFGGVVPNLAAREHLKNILPVIETSMRAANVSAKNIDLIAVTNGPGLIPALMIGTNTAKTLAYLWKKPLIGVHHTEGHIYANFIHEKPKFPLLCLVVSGGHTQLVLMKSHLNYKIIGQTLDDAAGEAFDKVARMLNLAYPGGPAVAKMAKKHKSRTINNKLALPRPMINSKDFNFSFSGLKTAVLYTIKKHSNILKNVRMLSELCYEFQQAVIDVLIAKTLSAAKKHKIQTILLAGGVSANQELRKQLEKAVKDQLDNASCTMPDIALSVDNAAMVAIAGFFRWQKMSAKQREASPHNWKSIQANANLKIV